MDTYVFIHTFSGFPAELVQIKVTGSFQLMTLPCEVTLGGKLLVAYRDSEEEGAGGTESQRTPRWEVA